MVGGMIHLLAGTKKGLFIFSSSDRTSWTMRGPFLAGKEVNHAVWDGRSQRIYATSNDAWFGSQVTWSSDFGDTWQPPEQSPAFGAETGLKLDRIWHIEPGLENDNNLIFAGVAPAALFASYDCGVTWKEFTGLSQHPTRSKWFPGAGGLCLHSIVLDRTNPKRIYVGISAAGVFRSDDGGLTWHTANKGTRAEFLPDKYPEFGQCVHKLLASPAKPNLLYQQNHCGVYRSDTAGEKWEEITAGLPSDFGFGLALHPRDPDTLYLTPLQGGEFRAPVKGEFAIWRSRDGGKTWAPMREGLPGSGSYFGVYREGMANDSLNPAGIYVGTNTGKIFASRDEGDSWYLLADDLPPVFSVEIINPVA